MKRIFAAILVLFCIMLATIQSASALTYSDTKDWGLLEGWLKGTGTLSWQHAVTPDFQVPYDNLVSASLVIDAWFVDGNNDKIFVENTYFGKLDNGALWTFCPSSSNFDIGSLFTTWASGTPLDVTLGYKETGWHNYLKLDKSVFTLNYENLEQQNPPITAPEPGTIMMLGLGLMAIAAIRRKY